MTARYITVKGSNTIALSPYYVGLVQHERTMSKKEAYAYCAERTGFTPTQVRAVFMALAEYVRENQARGNITFIDEVASIRNYVTGTFEGLTGPKPGRDCPRALLRLRIQTFPHRLPHPR